jgi:hypothetical protein
VPRAAAEVEHGGSGVEHTSQPGHGAEETVHELLVVDAPPSVAGNRAHRVEVRPERGVRHAATFGEALLQLGQYPAESTQHQRHRGRVRRRVTNQERGMLGGQGVLRGARVVVEEPAGNHRAQPFPDIALLQARAVREPGAGGRPWRGRLEHTGAIPQPTSIVVAVNVATMCRPNAARRSSSTAHPPADDRRVVSVTAAV